MNTINTSRQQIRQHIFGATHKLEWLAPVRMLIIVMISFGYASTMPRGPQNSEYLSMFGYDPSWYGISLIFMITGFLALRSLNRHGSAIKFLLSRIGRNIPTLAVFAGAVVLVIFPLLGDNVRAHGPQTKQSLNYFIKVVSCFNPDELTPGLLDNALYMCIIQGGIWTFRWGLIAFVATAILWTMGGLRRRTTLLILTLGMMVIYASLIMYGIKHPSEEVEILVTGLRLAWPYLAGMCAYSYRDQLPRQLLVPAAILGLSGLQYFAFNWTPFIEISATIAFGYFVFLAVTNPITPPTWLKRTPDLSLGLYIFNWPSAQLTLLMLPSLNPMALFALSLPITVVVAFISWALVSRRINFNLGKKLSIQQI